MEIPEFLKADLNNCKRTTNKYRKFHKYIYFNLLLLKYITSIFYAASKITNLKTKKIDNFILKNFYIPTEGSWLNLLELLQAANLPALKKQKKILKNKVELKNKDSFIAIINKYIIDNHLNLKDLSIIEYFYYINLIKTKLISHGTISEEKAENIMEILEKITSEVIHIVQPIISLPIYLIEEDKITSEYEAKNMSDNLTYDLSQNIIKNDFVDDGVYLVFGEKLSFISPLIVCRDGNILFYNKFDKKHSKILLKGPNSSESYLKTGQKNLSDLFYLDTEMLNLKPLENNINIEQNNLYHNLPLQDHNKFIGRRTELKTLNKMMLHPRHFITALDGIGGVGKSSIALEFAYSICKLDKTEPLYFEYIIWISAKTTKLENGEIIKLKQSFEHLDQLLDTVLDVTGFTEYKSNNLASKKEIVLQILNETKVLIILDNLETLKKELLEEIWNFLNNIPVPSKILLTSREYHYDVSQHLNVTNLSDEDTKIFIKEYCKQLKFSFDKIQPFENQIVKLASGLPIAISSILGQLFLGKKFKTIKKNIENNHDDLTRFCFKEQFDLLNNEQMIVLRLICLSTETINYDALTYMLDTEIKSNLLNILNELKSFSIIKINSKDNDDIYYTLPIIKNYVNSINLDPEIKTMLEEKLSDYYQLKDIDNYELLPIEERNINKGSIIPRKIVERAMQYANRTEFDEADALFIKALKKYPNESYVFYLYSMYLAQYKTLLPEAIKNLKKANIIEPNYIYLKKIGDYNLRLKNYQKAIEHYEKARKQAKIDRNKDEMLFCLGNAQFKYVKQVRRNLHRAFSESNKEKRNSLYNGIIENFTSYLKSQSKIYPAKKVNIYRILSEAYFGISDKNNAIKFIDMAINLSDEDEFHLNYKDVILNSN